MFFIVKIEDPEAGVHEAAQHDREPVHTDPASVWVDKHDKRSAGELPVGTGAHALTSTGGAHGQQGA